MDIHEETGYQPSSEYLEDDRDPLIDLDLTDSNELWLIQWPINEPPDFDRQQASLNLQADGHLGTFEGSSGKSYDMFNCKSQGPEAMVFISSASEAKIVGKIARHVSLISYPEASEWEKRNPINWGTNQRVSQATLTMSGRRTTTTHSRSSKPRKSSTSSGKTKSSLPGRSKQPSQKRNKSGSHSGQDSGKGNSDITSTGSLGN